MVKPWEVPIADLKCGHIRPRLPGEGGWERFGFCFVCPPVVGGQPLPDIEWIHTQWWVFQW